MRIYKIILGLIISVIISSCGVPQSDYDKLKSELDECKFGADKLIASVEKSYSEKNYSEAKQNIKNLAQKHPESTKNKEFVELLKKIDQEELVENAKKEAKKKEKTRLANLNNTGIWSITYYVDEFGEKTKEGYITNTNLINGSFSNTATQNSALDVKFLITNSSDISFELYEYAGNNPVKTSSSDSYTILLQDKEGNRLKLQAINYSDRLRFEETEARKVHNALLKGGTLKFKVTENDTPTTEYEFIIQNADWYENAYKKLKESK